MQRTYGPDFGMLWFLDRVLKVPRVCPVRRSIFGHCVVVWLHQKCEVVGVDTLLNKLAAFSEFPVLELGIVAFVALCEVMIATTRRPDSLKSFFEIQHCLSN